ncbi:MAG: hypothetical protein L0Y42_01070 [Phycisphaerales bacterium]|nr:hypothetical protein [Phycisphaerales bacterium]
MLAQIGSAEAGSLGHLVLSPLLNGLVVAGKEDFGHLAAAPDAWPGVVGAVEEAAGLWIIVRALEGEGVLCGGLVIAECAGEESNDGIDQEQGGYFAAAEDVVADAELQRLQFIDDSFINSFVMACDQHEAWLGCEFFDALLIE